MKAERPAADAKQRKSSEEIAFETIALTSSASVDNSQKQNKGEQYSEAQDSTDEMKELTEMRKSESQLIKSDSVEGRKAHKNNVVEEYQPENDTEGNSMNDLPPHPFVAHETKNTEDFSNPSGNQSMSAVSMDDPNQTRKDTYAFEEKEVYQGCCVIL